jgi:hypothetical protein
VQLRLTPNPMKELLDRIIDAKYRENTFYYDEPERPEPGPPAGAETLSRLDAYLAGKGLRIPPSYREFLGIYDGIKGVLGPGYSLLPVHAVVEEAYDVLPENQKEFPNLCEFVFAAGDTLNFMGFDVATGAADGEYEAVEVDADGGEWRHRSFRAFLEAYLEVLRGRVAAEEQDRQNLPE